MTSMKRYPATIIATACIPWDEQYQFDEPRFRRQVRRLIENGMTHIYLFGTAGEGFAVNQEQYEAIVRAFGEEMSGPELYPMVGVISLSMQLLQERLATAYAMGIRDFQFALPSWSPLTDDETVSFVQELCEPYPDCRFMHYNTPKSNKVVSPALYVKLAELVPNLVASKFPSHDLATIHDIVETPSPIQFFLGEFGYAYASMLGECGLLVSSGATNLANVRLIHEAGQAQNIQAVMPMISELRAMDKKLHALAGPGYINGAFDKARYCITDPEFPTRMLSPYKGLSRETTEKFGSFVRQTYPQWMEGGMQ